MDLHCMFRCCSLKLFQLKEILSIRIHIKNCVSPHCSRDRYTAKVLSTCEIEHVRPSPLFSSEFFCISHTERQGCEKELVLNQISHLSWFFSSILLLCSAFFFNLIITLCNIPAKFMMKDIPVLNHFNPYVGVWRLFSWECSTVCSTWSSSASSSATVALFKFSSFFFILHFSLMILCSSALLSLGWFSFLSLLQWARNNLGGLLTGPSQLYFGSRSDPVAPIATAFKKPVDTYETCVWGDFYTFDCWNGRETIWEAS